MPRKPDETVALTCELPPHEMELLLKELSGDVAHLIALEAEKSALTSSMGEQIKKTQKRIKELNSETQTGKGVRSVVCKWSIERHATGKREWVLRRTDTAEPVRVEPLSAADDQLEMPH